LPSGLQRLYSLCGDPADRRHYSIAVQLAAHSRGGSEWLHTYAAPGLVLEVSGPQNHFRLEPARDYLFIAGGIGITPIKAMIESLPADRQWRLIYAGRSRSAMAFLGEVLERWPSRVTVSVRDEAEGRVDLSRVLAESDAEVYRCGPESLMNDVAARVPADRLHLERFVPMTRPAGGARFMSRRMNRSLTRWRRLLYPSTDPAAKESAVPVRLRSSTGVPSTSTRS
jgi:ferredoxin-NADP reductase